MDVIVSLLQQAFFIVVPFVVLLGVLIFVHELGHFSVAKYFGVRVEVFSLGFGKKLIKFTRGDTTYSVSAIPFGGYVKMFGEDPQAELPEEEKKYSFAHKPVGQRIAVVLAGPLMNLFFAIFLFSVIAAYGEKMPLAVVGQVEAYSDAAKAGFEPGDRILKVDGKDVLFWNDFLSAIEPRSNQKTSVQVQRFATQEVDTLTLTPSLEKNPNILSVKRKVGYINGLNLTPTASAFGVSKPDSLAAKKSLETGDAVLEWNSQKVNTWYELVHYANQSNTDEELKITVLKKNQEERVISFSPEELQSLDFESGILSAIGLEYPLLFVAAVKEGSAAEKAGIQYGDQFLKINGDELVYWQDLVQKVKSYEPGGSPLDAVVRRNGEILNIRLEPTKLTYEDPLTKKEKKERKIGIGPLMYASAPKTEIFRTSGFGATIGRGLEETWNWTLTTCVSFLRLLENQVSAKSIGGVITIGQLASQTFQIGLSPFLKIMAIISINLFILNLLPIPVLDGGHLLFYSIEAIKGSPLSMKNLEIAQQLGLVLLMFLMVFALFNDITRVLGISW